MSVRNTSSSGRCVGAGRGGHRADSGKTQLPPAWAVACPDCGQEQCDWATPIFLVTFVNERQGCVQSQKNSESWFCCPPCDLQKSELGSLSLSFTSCKMGIETALRIEQIAWQRIGEVEFHSLAAFVPMVMATLMRIECRGTAWPGLGSGRQCGCCPLPLFDGYESPSAPCTPHAVRCSHEAARSMSGLRI